MNVVLLRQTFQKHINILMTRERGMNWRRRRRTEISYFRFDDRFFLNNASKDGMLEFQHSKLLMSIQYIISQLRQQNMNINKRVSMT